MKSKKEPIGAMRDGYEMTLGMDQMEGGSMELLVSKTERSSMVKNTTKQVVLEKYFCCAILIVSHAMRKYIFCVFVI